IYRPPHAAGRMTRGAAGVLAVTSRLVGREAEARRTRAAEVRRLTEVTCRTPRVLSGSEPGYLRFPLLPGPVVQVPSVVRRGRQLGLSHGYPSTLAELPGFRSIHEPVPGAQTLVRQLVTSPTHSAVTGNDLVSAARILCPPAPPPPS